MIASKDSDFHQLTFLTGSPPKILWRWVGNASTVAIIGIIFDHAAVIKAFVAMEDEALLVLPDLARRQDE